MLHARQVTRLCYCASVLRTRPNGLEASREPIQIGAEIYGHAGLEADIEAIDLLLQSLAIAGISGIGRVRLDLCDLGPGEAAARGPARTCRRRMSSRLLQGRDLPELRQLLEPSARRPAAAAVLDLTQCFGPAARGARARATVARPLAAGARHPRPAGAGRDLAAAGAACRRGRDRAGPGGCARLSLSHRACASRPMRSGHAQAMGRGRALRRRRCGVRPGARRHRIFARPARAGGVARAAAGRRSDEDHRAPWSDDAGADGADRGAARGGRDRAAVAARADRPRAGPGVDRRSRWQGGRWQVLDCTGRDDKETTSRDVAA